MKIRVGDVLSGKYQVERHLARGGMGSVWVARDLKLCRRVAVKFIEIPPNDAADATMLHARFEREALAAARLNTPHVVQVYDHALDSATPYIVMEYLEGEGLNARFSREGRLSFADAVGIMNQTARGLRAAHEAGIVHRDLKPANIFLAKVDHEQVVKILDFGIAKLMDHRSVTADGEIFGSARYMSPEQIVGAKDLDLRSDLWSMAVILYRAITGSDAFSRDIVETVMALRQGRFPAATTVAPHLVPDVDAFFERALAVDRNRRFLSAVEMAEAFADVAKQQAAATTTTRVKPLAPAPLAGEQSKTTRFVVVAPTDLVEPTDLDAPTEVEAPEQQAPTELDAPTPQRADKSLGVAPPHEEETLSATARETRPPLTKRSRASLLALAVIGLGGAAGFALWPRSNPVGGDVRSPPAVESAPPSPAAPPADPEAAESVAPPAAVAPPGDPEAAESAAPPQPAAPAAAPAPPSSMAAAATSPSDPESTRRPPPAARASAHGDATPRPTAAAKPNCKVPYTVDAAGVRHPIKACLY